MTLKPKVYGLIGFPIQHSLSPCMHNAALSALKIKAKYKLFQLQSGQLKDFLNNLGRNNITGFNVTIPYKETILPYLNNRSFGVREIGAANTVVVTREGKLKGFNTDFLGFSRHLKVLKVKPQKIALIGAGGAARAVCFALGKMKAKEICIYDIDVYKSLGMMRQFKDLFIQSRFSAVARIEELNLAEKDLLVNASPVGMRPQDPCLVQSRDMPPGLFVYDLIYNPDETRLLGQARQAGVGFSNGLGMLLYQGVKAFEHFTKRKAPVEIMRAALEKGARKL